MFCAGGGTEGYGVGVGEGVSWEFFLFGGFLGRGSVLGWEGGWEGDEVGGGGGGR